MTIEQAGPAGDHSGRRRHCSASSCGLTTHHCRAPAPAAVFRSGWPGARRGSSKVLPAMRELAIQQHQRAQRRFSRPWAGSRAGSSGRGVGCGLGRGRGLRRHWLRRMAGTASAWTGVGAVKPARGQRGPAGTVRGRQMTWGASGACSAKAFRPALRAAGPGRPR